jgi:tetratricopeptide (TPR) repeat protein
MCDANRGFSCTQPWSRLYFALWVLAFAGITTATTLTGPPTPEAAADALTSDAWLSVEDPPEAKGDLDVETRRAADALEKGQWNRALESATRAVRLGAQNGDTLGTIALAGTVLGDRKWVDAALARLNDPASETRLGTLVGAVQDLKAGNDSAALQALASLLERSPQDPLALYFRGEAEHQAGWPAQALETFRRVKEVAPEFAPALAAAARLLAGSDIDEAVRLMELAAAIHPENLAYRRRLAEFYATAGRQAEANRLYVEILADIPGVRQQYLNAAWQMQRTGQPDKALQQVARAEQRWGPNALGSLIATMAEIDRGQPAAAKRHLTAYLDSSPDRSHALATAGLCHLALRDPDAAITHLEGATELQPGNSQARVNLAVARQLAGDRAGAARSIERAAAAGEHADVIAYVVANLALSKGDLALYEDRLAAAGRLLPGAVALSRPAAATTAVARRQTAAQHNLMLVMFLNQWHTQVIRSAERILSMLPDDALATYFLGLAAEQQSRLVLANQSLGKAVETAPGFTAALLASGRVALKLGRAEAAVDAYRAVADQEPGNLAAKLGLSGALLAGGKRQEAQLVLADAESLAESGPEMFEVANLMQQLGQHQRSREMLEKALATPEQGRWRQEAAARLAGPMP